MITGHGGHPCLCSAFSWSRCDEAGHFWYNEVLSLLCITMCYVWPPAPATSQDWHACSARAREALFMWWETEWLWMCWTVWYRGILAGKKYISKNQISNLHRFCMGQQKEARGWSHKQCHCWFSKGSQCEKISKQRQERGEKLKRVKVKMETKVEKRERKDEWGRRRRQTNLRVSEWWGVWWDLICCLLSIVHTLCTECKWGMLAQKTKLCTSYCLPFLLQLVHQCCSSCHITTAARFGFRPRPLRHCCEPANSGGELLFLIVLIVCALTAQTFWIPSC